MDTYIKDKFFKNKKIIISVILIILAIGLTFLIINVFAATLPSSCPLGTDTTLSECQSCLDLTALPTTISAGNSSTLTLQVESKHNGVPNPSWTMDCSINNGVLSNTTLNNGSYNYSVSPISATTYTVNCTGVGGVPLTTTGSVTVTVVDTTDPTISFNPVSRSWANTNADVIVTASDASGISDIYYCWTTGVSCTPSTSFTNGSVLTKSSDGSWNLCIKAIDKFNNEKTQCSGRYQIDKTIPTVDSFSVDGNTSNFSTYDTSLTIDWSVSDSGGSNLLRVEVWRQTDGGSWSNVHQESISNSSNSGSWTNTVTCGHNYEYGIHVVDNADNVGQEVSPITANVQCNASPFATNLAVDPLDYCTYSLPTRLSWDFSDPDVGDVQEYYQIQADDNAFFLSPEVDSGKIHSVSDSYMASGFSYDIGTYHWRLKVWDDKGADSGWIPGPPFPTPSHKYPDPDFTWSPSSPSINEIVQLCAVQTGVCATNQSTCYNASNNPISCSGKTFLWTLPAEAEFATTSVANTENPEIKFTDSGDYEVILKITDDIGSCSQSHQIQATLPLPEWEETSP